MIILYARLYRPQISSHLSLARKQQVVMASVVSALAAALVLPACAVDTLLSDEEAIQIALDQARVGASEISAAQAEPNNIQAEPMTFAEAAERLTGSATVGRGDDPDMTVWLVTMDGLWLDEFPRPAGVPTPEPFHRYTVVVDALTGGVLMTTASR